jgi:hypothetical protein
MKHEPSEKNKEKEDNKNAAVKPDAETLNTTDPQEHMEGPLSSLMHDAGDAFESESAEKEAEEKKKKR